MESRVKLFGHPVHQMLVTFPIGAFGVSVAGDVLHSLSGRRGHAAAARVALDVGLASGALAVPFGLIDYLAIERGSRARRIGLWHAVGNAALLGLFATARVLRSDAHTPRSAKLFAGAGFLLSGLTAWLGGELIVRHGVGVHDRGLQAAPNAVRGAPHTGLLLEPIEADEIGPERVPGADADVDPPTSDRAVRPRADSR